MILVTLYWKRGVVERPVCMYVVVVVVRRLSYKKEALSYIQNILHLHTRIGKETADDYNSYAC